jgi:hypothetical protein
MNTTLLWAVKEQQVWAAKHLWVIVQEAFLSLGFFVEVTASIQSLVYIYLADACASKAAISALLHILLVHLARSESVNIR